MHDLQDLGFTELIVYHKGCTKFWKCLFFDTERHRFII